MNKSTVLVVDDERHILELVSFNLGKEGYGVITAMDGIEACRIAKREKPDLIILDVMLPGLDGFEVCKTIQRDQDTSNIPIIMLTAKTQEIDKILGLEMGADDYMTKPFSPRELLARVKARLRRTHRNLDNFSKSEGIIRINGFAIDPERYEVSLNDTSLNLTPKEFELLRYLVANKGKVLTRDCLLEKIWGYEYMGDTRTVDVHIRHLRQKIEADPANPKYIETVRGIGYKFKEKA
jgi:two-component system alkaline phosphatase synthesis response regulator PhoP